MKALEKRVDSIESTQKPEKFRCWYLFTGSQPRLQKRLGGEPLYFQSKEQFNEFMEVAENFTPQQAKSVCVFPINFGGEPEPLPEKRKVITGWNADLSKITATKK